MGKRIALIGSGNAFFKDEGIGLYAAKYLKENYEFTPNISIVDGGTLGFRLMPLLQEHDEVIIVNTASEEATIAGVISVKSCDDFLEGSLIKKTANEVEIAEMLQICALSEHMADTTIISIVPEDIISVEVGLTDHLVAAWPKYIDTVLQVLGKCGVEARKKSKTMPLEEVLHTFSSPSIEHGRGF
ncbi:hydrogenase maturation protease [Sulfurimonas sp. HSL3-7]|uniref:hydrogenase maturation protease n=1 Tax=Sulfonitrofixus jiaomeiensis TaxID=3131938 RepID=UPI0031FA01EA